MIQAWEALKMIVFNYPWISDSFLKIGTTEGHQVKKAEWWVGATVMNIDLTPLVCLLSILWPLHKYYSI